MKYQAQPAIKDEKGRRIKRIPRSSAIHPVVDRVIREIMKEDKKSYSYVVAEFASQGAGVDFLTGKVLKKASVLKFRKAG